MCSTALAERDICLLDYAILNDDDCQYLRQYFFDNVFPLLTPQSIDPAHPFPFISNLSLNLLVGVKFPGGSGKTSLTRIKVPVGLDVPRFIQLHGRHQFVKLEDVIVHNLDTLLPDMEVVSCELFRVTRNANTERNEEHADDLLSMIESELRDRRFAPIVRLQVQQGMDSGPSRHAGGRAAPRRERRRVRRGRRPARHARPVPDSPPCRWPSCAIRRTSPSTIRS